MRRRISLLQRQSARPPRSGLWSRLFTAKLIGGITLVGFVLYVADAISQNALGQFGVSVIQWLFIQIHVITPVIWLCGFIALLTPLLIGLFILVVQQQRSIKRLEQENKRLEREIQQQNYIIQADENFFNRPPHLNLSEEEGEANES